MNPFQLPKRRGGHVIDLNRLSVRSPYYDQLHLEEFSSSDCQSSSASSCGKTVINCGSSASQSSLASHLSMISTESNLLISTTHCVVSAEEVAVAKVHQNSWTPDGKTRDSVGKNRNPVGRVLAGGADPSSIIQNNICTKCQCILNDKSASEEDSGYVGMLPKACLRSAWMRHETVSDTLSSFEEFDISDHSSLQPHLAKSKHNLRKVFSSKKEKDSDSHEKQPLLHRKTASHRHEQHLMFFCKLCQKKFDSQQAILKLPCSHYFSLATVSPTKRLQEGSLARKDVAGAHDKPKFALQNLRNLCCTKFKDLPLREKKSESDRDSSKRK